jgi:hypothetical protein
MFFLCFVLPARSIRVLVEPNRRNFTWRPSRPHSIVLFPQTLRSDLRIHILSPTGAVVQDISKDRSVIGVNFGVDASFSVRFQAVEYSMSFALDVFEPNETSDQYVISTSPRTNFGIASRGLCARPDFEITNGESYGFFSLNRVSALATSPDSKLTDNDQLRFILHDLEKGGQIQDIRKRETVDRETHAFSQWIVKIWNEPTNRIFVLHIRPTVLIDPSDTYFRASFTKTSKLTLLRSDETTGRSDSEEPCNISVSEGEQNNTRDSNQKGDTEVSAFTATTMIKIGIGIILTFATVAFVGATVLRARQRPMPKPVDLEELLSKSRESSIPR